MNILCIDAGVGGGYTWNIGDKVYTSPMKSAPTGTKGLDATKHQTKYVDLILEYILDETMAGYDCGMDKIYIEQVGPRFGDTPKTSWGLSANYHCISMWFHTNMPDCLTFVLPQVWMPQLPIELPSGKANYSKRKKALQDFAVSQYGTVTQLTFGKNDKPKLTENRKITSKTADSTCMHWIYSNHALKTIS
jgi:hypothetical protein